MLNGSDTFDIFINSCTISTRYISYAYILNVRTNGDTYTSLFYAIFNCVFNCDFGCDVIGVNDIINTPFWLLLVYSLDRSNAPSHYTLP